MFARVVFEAQGRGEVFQRHYIAESARYDPSIKGCYKLQMWRIFVYVSLLGCGV